MQPHIISKVAQFSDESLKETKGLRSWLELSIPSGIKTLIRQNNTIIELCVYLSKQVEKLETRVKSLEAQKSSATLPEDLITKLGNLTLGPKEKPKEPKGLLRVHRDPTGRGPAINIPERPAYTGIRTNFRRETQNEMWNTQIFKYSYSVDILL